VLREKLYCRHEEAEPGEAAGEGDLSGERAHPGSGPRAGRVSGGGAEEEGGATGSVSATIEGEGRPAPCEVEGESSAGRATGATPYDGGGTG